MLLLGNCIVVYLTVPPLIDIHPIVGLLGAAFIAVVYMAVAFFTVFAE